MKSITTAMETLMKELPLPIILTSTKMVLEIIRYHRGFEHQKDIPIKVVTVTTLTL